MKRGLCLLIAVLMVLSANAAYRLKNIRSPKGTTLTGVIYCGGQPLAGVQVSDGEHIVFTNNKGVYNIPSSKPYGVVFVTTPSGYEPVMKDAVRPGFWARTSMDATTKERYDFEMKAVDDSKFSVMMFSDTHFCDDKQKKDVKYFAEMVMPAVHRAFNDAGGDIFSVNLGDITWDRFWYSNGFDIERVPQHLIDNKFPMPFYCVHGNHDYDPSVPSDDNPNHNAIQRFCNTFGPTFYSMNKGGVHFVFLDNIVYKNEVKAKQKRAKGVAGSRNYDLYILEEQLEWLKKDLSIVDKKMPIVVCMHAPMFTCDDEGKQIYGFVDGQTELLVDILKDFADVKIFSGHSHRVLSFVHPQYSNIVEYNLTSVSGDLWNTPDAYGVNIGEDGADAGFYVCTFDNGEFSKRWYSCNTGSEYPFRAYDMNEVAAYYAVNPTLQHLCNLYSTQNNYAESQYANYVYINCWSWEEGCSLIVTENGKQLEVEQVDDSDPMGAAVIFAKPSILKSTTINDRTSRLSISANMFRVKTQSADTSVDITLKTPYGDNFTQTMQRPAKFLTK